ncbi:MAG: O-acetylhomoserine aminocarboxypropyltransferase/cysteine synthase [Marinifilaceae bacterium]|jgi:O-acetylhomoserine (thiol)-lyase|nr:O-acetylhomoserine aminocarboxypropyltransferase/cysteine synthase [Marinifilaceae bacterium]
MTNSLNYESLQVHAGFEQDETNSCTTAIHQSSAYTFKSSKHAVDLFELNEFGNIYTRIGNPTNEVFEKRIAALEGGSGALACSSGQSAQFLALTNILRSGENFICADQIYGGSFNQFKIQFQRLGIECRFFDTNNTNDAISKIDKNTKAIFVETLPNPKISVPDFERYVELAKSFDLPLIVDNTFGAAGYVFKPIEHGANIIVHSTTKWICGHGTTMGGVIIDAGNYNWGNGKYPQFTQASEAYHGFKFWEKFGYDSPYGNIAFIIRARVEGMRDYGCCQSPFNSFLLLQGLETLSLRLDRQISNTQNLAEWLIKQEWVENVNYPGLKTDKYYNLAKKYFKKGAGSVLTFKLKAGRDTADIFIEKLNLIKHITNLGDVKTLIVHPASTTHQQLSKEEQIKCGVEEGLLRLSVGIEHIDDLKQDIQNAINETLPHEISKPNNYQHKQQTLIS